MLAGEAQVPGASGSVAGGLKKKFNLTDADIAFYTVHDHADGEHSDAGREMLSRFALLRDVDALGSDSPFVAFIEPPSLDARILNQFALFSLMPDASAHMNAWLDAHPHLHRRIVIPASLKWEIRDKLDQANINERTLFPGLDGLSRWLERYYTPKP